jgi:hypothetical protein
VLLVCWGCFVNGIGVAHSSQSSRSPPLPSCYAGRVDIVDVWGWPPLMVNEVSHDLDGGEVETPSLPCTISNVGSKWSPQFCFYGINSEPLTLLLWPFTSLDESGPSLSLILKLALLYCLQWMGVMTLDASAVGVLVPIIALYHLIA